ncbi:hypothetical protein HRbin40_00704 [bacterium HR40]|nr:hypothetical protein HRbin40_00704 [bacterium HR40]
MPRLATLLPLLLLLVADGAAGETAAARAGGPAPDEPATAVTLHQLDSGGERLSFRATAGFLPIPDPEDPAADMFFVAYQRIDGDGFAARPVTFFLNGGPGAASVWLHLGAAGPKRLRLEPDGQLSSVPGLDVNPHSWLAFTDLVFVDPVGTGFSRPRPRSDGSPGGAHPQDFFTVSRDLESLAAFMRLWLDRFGRRSSPPFLVGESYGGFRAARLARLLEERFDIRLKAVVLVSPVLEFELLRGADDHNLLPWLTRYPSFALTAGYHGRGRYAGIEEVDERLIAELEDWASGELLSGLARLPRLPEAEARAFLVGLSDRLGLPPELVIRRRGRIGMQLFAKELLRDRQRIVGLYDGRASGADPRPDRPQHRGGDPSFDPLAAAFAAAFSSYLAQELGWRTDRRYLVLARELAEHWDYRDALEGGMGYPGASDDLVEALALLPDMRVLIVHGLYDLVTAWYATRWVIDHEPMPESARARIDWLLLPGGHMPYLDARALRRLDERVRSFYRSALGGISGSGP